MITDLDVARSEESMVRAVQAVPRVAKAKKGAVANANLTVAGTVNGIVGDMDKVFSVLNGDPSAAVGKGIADEISMITEAAITDRNIGERLGMALAAEATYMTLANQHRAEKLVESRIAGNPELQRAEAAKRRIEIGQTDVLAKGEVGKGLLTEQPITVKQPEDQKPSQEREPRVDPREKRRPGLAGKLLGLDS